MFWGNWMWARHLYFLEKDMENTFGPGHVQSMVKHPGGASGQWEDTGYGVGEGAPMEGKAWWTRSSSVWRVCPGQSSAPTPPMSGTSERFSFGDPHPRCTCMSTSWGACNNGHDLSPSQRHRRNVGLQWVPGSSRFRSPLVILTASGWEPQIQPWALSLQMKKMPKATQASSGSFFLINSNSARGLSLPESHLQWGVKGTACLVVSVRVTRTESAASTPSSSSLWASLLKGAANGFFFFNPVFPNIQFSTQ